jgi:hypothetical protein
MKILLCFEGEDVKHSCTKNCRQCEKGYMMLGSQSIQILPIICISNCNHHQFQCSYHHIIHPLAIRFHLHKWEYIWVKIRSDDTLCIQYRKHISLVLYPRQSEVYSRMLRKFSFHL